MVSLDEAEHYLAQSRCQRRYAPILFGFIPDLAFGFARISSQPRRTCWRPSVAPMFEEKLDIASALMPAA